MGLDAKSCLTLETPWTVACQAPLSMGFSRQAYWSGCHFLLQRIFPTQGSNPGLLHCRQSLYQLRYKGSPLLILVSFSSPFNLASSGFLAAAPLISNCWNPPFGIQARSRRLESCLEDKGEEKGLGAWECPRALLTINLTCLCYYQLTE